MVLFDRHGTFIGPVVEVSGLLAESKYCVKLELDSILRVKSTSLKIGDPLYYYNCDRLSAEIDTMQDELTLIESKQRCKHQRSGLKPKASKHATIDNLRDDRLDYGAEVVDDRMDEEINSTTKNTRSIASVVLNSCYNKKLIENHLEKQKAKRYRRIKTLMLGNLNKLSEEKWSVKERKEEKIEDELELGKRNSRAKMSIQDSFINHSTDYSKNSWDADKNNSSNGDKLTLSNESSKEILWGALNRNTIHYQNIGQTDHQRYFMQSLPSTQK